MKIEFLLNGSEACPLIRIYQGTLEDYGNLIGVIDDIISGKKLSVEIDELKGFQSLGNIRLEFLFSQINIGITQVSETAFKCQLSKTGWAKVKQLITPFVSEEKDKYQWLDETSNISLLLSDKGNW